ncbi:MAG: electron transfer flavoprotein beta subunit/FixA family protein [Marinilabiliaceae bacterium]|nr:electron transfer flavoprotein beta subunit/FixA family protein [Marinilabiliaceae bacterium]
MKLLVCISNVPDTTTKLRFKDNSTAINDIGVQWVINPWDELALTRAVALKDEPEAHVSEVWVVNVGLALTEPTLRKCLAMGADKAIRIDANPKDAFYTATQLMTFIQTETFGFVICGIESGDYNGASVGGMLAEILDVPSVSSVSGIRFEKEHPVIQRDVANGKEEVTVDGLAVLIVQKGFAKAPGIPNMRGIMMARKKPLVVMTAIESEPLVTFVEYKLPPVKSQVKLVEANQVAQLVDLLSKEAKVI